MARRIVRGIERDGQLHTTIPGVICTSRLCARRT